MFGSILRTTHDAKLLCEGFSIKLLFVFVFRNTTSYLLIFCILYNLFEQNDIFG